MLHLEARPDPRPTLVPNFRWLSLPLVCWFVIAGSTSLLLAQEPVHVAQQPVHVVRMGRPRAAANTCSFAPHVTYYGGPVMSNVQVYAVFWGPNVNSETLSKIGGFFTDITNSSYHDILSEYNTVGKGPPTSNQVIGRGSFAGQTTITPSLCNTTAACTVDDTQIQAEVISQITAGHLPKPAVDSGGKVNTLYMIYFPPNIT